MKRSFPHVGFLFSALLCIGQIVAVAQQNTPEKYVRAGVQMSGRNVPFFQRINQYGVVPVEEGNQLYVEAGWYSKKDSAFLKKQKDWTWGYGVESRVVQGNTARYAFLPVAEVHAQWKKWEMYAGRRKEMIGLVDTTQTIGAYTWSGNMPMPKIQISTVDWVNFAHGWLGFKAGLAHG